MNKQINTLARCQHQKPPSGAKPLTFRKKYFKLNIARLKPQVLAICLYLISGKFNNRFLAWESAFSKPGETLWLKRGRDLLQERYLQRHQQYTEFRTNFSLLIQEYNKNITRICNPMRPQWYPMSHHLGVTEEQFTKHLRIFYSL